MEYLYSILKLQSDGDRKLQKVTAVILALLTVTLHTPVLAVITVFCWGIAAFGIMPGIQIRIMNLAHEAPLLAATSSHSALNLGNAGGAYLGGLAITHTGLTSSAILALLALVGAMLSYYQVERSTRLRASIQ